MTIEEIIQSNEGKTVEFKENALAKEKIIATIIAFANTAGGCLVIGIEDKTRHIIGIENPHQVVEKLANMIYDTIEPRLIPNIEIIAYRNTNIICIEVFPSSLRPHYERSKGKDKSTYIRIGSTTRSADKDLIRAIERSTATRSFDEEIYYEARCEDIDLDRSSHFFPNKPTFQKKDWVTLGILRKEGDNFFPTVGGLLLFSPQRLSFFPDAWIQIGVFQGIDKAYIVSTQRITTLLPLLVEEALSFIKKNVRVGLQIEDIHHQEKWEIPKIALREAIINAVVHTDYSMNGAPIRISLFDDRIEIENTALLPWGLTIEDIESGVSKLRNPIIGRVFHELKLIEQWGSGIGRMKKSCKMEGLKPPRFEEIGARLRVTFFKERIKIPQIDKIDQKIINFLKKNNCASTQVISNHITLSRRGTINRLTRLVERGILFEIRKNINDPKKQYCLKK